MKRNKTTEILFCESNGKWAAWFRQINRLFYKPEVARNWVGRGDERSNVENRAKWLEIKEFRSLGELATGLLTFPESIICIEVDLFPVSQMADFMERIKHENRNARAVGLMNRNSDLHRNELRELGFIDIFSKPIELQSLYRLTKRHLGRIPEREISFRESIEAKMPWSS